ncbi:serine hydrolase [Streptosporangium sp. NPDC020072]|uniref:serine hydrolase n=1 Tax=Streptosporangium sp. NPDC020072 TaxID=3154788 RepID=UPI0034458BD3
MASPKVVASRLTRKLDRFLSGRGVRVAAAARDLSTGRSYVYHGDLRLPTASVSKVDILMALLLDTPWRELDARTRRDAERMIRISDNAAADRLYERIGLQDGLARANRRFGLGATYAPPGRCAGLYCWGITQTVAEDQVRLVGILAGHRDLLPEGDREQVLGLMRKVVARQAWGISAAACDGGRVALKNGWLHHVANRLWAVASVGLIREPGHDYAVAVLTEDGPRKDAGIAVAEGTARRVLAAFRGGECANGAGRPPTGAEDQAALSTSR